MSAQASLSLGRTSGAVRWLLWLVSCVVGQGLSYFFFLFAKVGKIDLPVWLFANGWGFIAVVLAPAIFVPALAWQVLRLGSRKVPVSLLQGVAVGVLAIVPGMIAQYIFALIVAALT